MIDTLRQQCRKQEWSKLEDRLQQEGKSIADVVKRPRTKGSIRLGKAFSFSTLQGQAQDTQVGVSKSAESRFNRQKLDSKASASGGQRITSKFDPSRQHATVDQTPKLNGGTAQTGAAAMAFTAPAWLGQVGNWISGAWAAGFRTMGAMH